MTTPPNQAVDDVDNGPEDQDPPETGDDVNDSDSGSDTGAGDSSTGQPTSQDNGADKFGVPDDAATGLKKALEAERKLRRQRDKELTELRRKHATAEERALIEAREAAANEAIATVRPALLKQIAAAKLEAAGATGNTERLAGLLNLDDVELADDGTLVGLADQIDGLKTEFPNLFSVRSVGGRPPAPRANAGAGSGEGRRQDNSSQGKPQGFAEKLAAQVMGG